jgi:hypothetical protein
MLVADLPDIPDAEAVRGFLETPLGIASIVLGLGIVVFVLAHFSGRMFAGILGPAPKNPEKGLGENLVEYPPPPKLGARQLTINGVPVRLRLVVVAPVGRSREIDRDGVNDLVNGVVRGLKEIILQDKPRVKFWPPQLSNEGFAPTFHRLAETPDEEGEPSCWVLVAGPANSAGRPILLGLACLASEANELGKIILTVDDWTETIRVQTVNA